VFILYAYNTAATLSYYLQFVISIRMVTIEEVIPYTVTVAPGKNWSLSIAATEDIPYNMNKCTIQYNTMYLQAEEDRGSVFHAVATELRKLEYFPKFLRFVFCYAYYTWCISTFTTVTDCCITSVILKIRICTSINKFLYKVNFAIITRDPTLHYRVCRRRLSSSGSSHGI
jgi:hypothetical protein